MDVVTNVTTQSTIDNYNEIQPDNPQTNNKQESTKEESVIDNYIERSRRKEGG